MSEERSEADAGARRRADWRATHEKIVRFLAEELSELGVKREAPRLITSVREISKRTGLSERVVRTYLSRRDGELAQAGAVLVRVGKTGVVIRLAGERR